MTPAEEGRRPGIHGPLATPDAVARGPAPFPATSAAEPIETGFSDWRSRLTGNLARRSDGRWTPLTWTHAAELPTPEKPAGD